MEGLAGAGAGAPAAEARWEDASPVAEDETIRSFDPAHPDREVASVRVPTGAELESMLELAVAAQAEWARSGPARCARMEAFADALAARGDECVDLMVREVGKPVLEARAELARALSIVRFYAQAALDPMGEEFPSPDGATRLVARRLPLGVVLAICPWNFPLAIPLWKAAPAIAFGNAVLLKPARAAVGVAELIGAAASEALPPGVLTVLPVPAGTAETLLDDERVAGVTFTGSTEVGLQVVSRMAARGAAAQAEMGGHNPAIVLEDADFDRAAGLVLAGAMGYAGQKCTATRRVIAVGPAREAIAGALAGGMSSLAVGDPADEATVVGPLIDAGAVSEYGQAVAEARDAGAEELAVAPEPPESGHFVRPALVALDDPRASINQEETFGPLLTVLGAADEEEALRIANGTRYGLSGAVHSRDLDRATDLAARLRCGMQRVNAPTTGVDYYAPFGGEAFSGFGPREQGRAVREHFTSIRTLTVSPP
jgi:acyl-CoA reductase-like NAD-dependent aldehyde dehydrogenase